MKKNNANPIDDRINVRVGGDLKKRLDAIAAGDPSNPGLSVVVRRLLVDGLAHQERCQKRGKS